MLPINVHDWTPEKVEEAIRHLVKIPGVYSEVIIREGLDGAYVSDAEITSPDAFVELLELTRLGDKGKVRKWVKDCQGYKIKGKDVISPAAGVACTMPTVLPSRAEEVGSRNICVTQTQVSSVAVSTTSGATGAEEWIPFEEIDKLMKPTLTVVPQSILNGEQLREQDLRASLDSSEKGDPEDEHLPSIRRLFDIPPKVYRGKRTFGKDFVMKFWEGANDIWNNNNKIIRKFFDKEKESMKDIVFNIRRRDRALPKATVDLLQRLQMMLDRMVIELGYETHLYNFPYPFLCKSLVAHRLYEESKNRKPEGVRSLPGGSLDWLDIPADQLSDLGNEEMSMKKAKDAGRSFPNLWLVAFTRKVSYDIMLRYQDKWRRKSWFDKLEDLDERDSLKPNEIYPGIVVGRVGFVRPVPISHAMYKQLIYWEVRLLEVFMDKIETDAFLLKRLSTEARGMFRNDTLKVNSTLMKKLGSNILVPMCNVYANLRRVGDEEGDKEKEVTLGNTQVDDGENTQVDNGVEGSGSSTGAAEQDVNYPRTRREGGGGGGRRGEGEGEGEGAGGGGGGGGGEEEKEVTNWANTQLLDDVAQDVAAQEDATSGSSSSTEMDAEEVNRLVDVDMDSDNESPEDQDSGLPGTRGTLKLPDSQEEKDEMLMKYSEEEKDSMLEFIAQRKQQEQQERLAKLVRCGALPNMVHEKQAGTPAKQFKTSTPALKSGKSVKQVGTPTQKRVKSARQVGTHTQKHGNSVAQVSTPAQPVGTPAKSGVLAERPQSRNLPPENDIRSPPQKRWRVADDLNRRLVSDENTPPTSLFERGTKVCLMDGKGLVGKGTYQHSDVGTLVHFKPLQRGQCCVMIEEIEHSRLKEFDDSLELGSRALWDVLMLKKVGAAIDGKAKKTSPTEHAIGRLSKVQTNGGRRYEEHKVRMLRKAKAMSRSERVGYLMKALDVPSEGDVVARIKELWPALWAESPSEGLSLRDVALAAPKSKAQFIDGYLKFRLVNDGLKFLVEPTVLFSNERSSV